MSGRRREGAAGARASRDSLRASRALGAGARERSGGLGLWLRALVVMLAVTGSCGLVALLGARLSARWDVTSTRAHRLAPRTLAVLERLATAGAGVTGPGGTARGGAGSVEIVIATDLSQTPASARDRGLDLLEAFERAGRGLRVTVIDTSAPGGPAKAEATLARLAEAARAGAGAQQRAIEEVLEAAAESPARLRGVSEALASVGAALPAGGDDRAQKLRGYFDDQAAAARVMADDFSASLAAARAALTPTAQTLGLPGVDESLRLVRLALRKLTGELGVLQTGLDRFAQAGSGVAELGVARDRAEGLSASLSPLRDGLARRLASLDGLETPAVLRVARLLRQTRAGVVIGPGPGGESAGAGADPVALALELDALLPRVAGLSAAEVRGAVLADTRARAEEHVTAALSALVEPRRPRVVFVHAAREPLGPGLGGLGFAAEALVLRGIDVGEWSVVQGEDEPADPRAPQRRGPTVYAITPIEVTGPEAAARMGRLARVLDGLLARGRPVLVTLNPSTLPGAGSADPMAEGVGALGVMVDTGRPLMELVAGGAAGGEGPAAVDPDVRLIDPAAEHAVSRAVGGLAMRLPWALPMRVDAERAARAGVRVTPVMTLPASPRRWAEAEWQELRRAMMAGQSPRSVPSPLGPGDDAGDGTGWLIAAAVEAADGARADGEAGAGADERAEGGGSARRVVVVASAGWFFDTFTRAGRDVDGKPQADQPGNVELLASSVLWLAGREADMAQSASAAAGPTIPRLSAGQEAAIRWVLIGAMPLGVLLLGLVWRAWRG